MSDPISTSLAQAPESVSRAAYASPGPATAGIASRSRSLFVPALIGFLVLGVVLLVVIGFLFVALGPGIVAVGGIMALVPLAIVLLVLIVSGNSGRQKLANTEAPVATFAPPAAGDRIA